MGARRRKKFHRLEDATEYTVELAQLPCWAHVSPEQYRERIAEIVERIGEKARKEREASGSKVLGVAAILRQDPTERPDAPKRSPQPPFHAATQAAFRALRDAYNLFAAAYRDAAERLKRGDRDVEFPEGSFPPPLPFVEAFSGCPP